ncbi:MAG: hypothetical protein HY646_15840 [Acidobacteria bacterium]|nr:hypothetical protein [Acidobacteriota bacterium]
MTEVVREFVMDFHKLALLIINLLPESYRNFLSIDLLKVSGFPSVSALNFVPVAAAIVCGVYPSSEFLFVLLAFGLVHAAVIEPF